MSRPAVTNDDRVAAIRLVRRLDCNKSCFVCAERSPQSVCTQLAIFVCMSCFGLLREVGFRCKSISMSEFTDDEVKRMQQGGNAEARKIWLSSSREEAVTLRDPSLVDLQSLPLADKEVRCRNFMRRCFVDEVWKAKPVSRRSSIVKNGKSSKHLKSSKRSSHKQESSSSEQESDEESTEAESPSPVKKHHSKSKRSTKGESAAAAAASHSKHRSKAGHKSKHVSESSASESDDESESSDDSDAERKAKARAKAKAKAKKLAQLKSSSRRSSAAAIDAPVKHLTTILPGVPPLIVESAASHSKHRHKAKSKAAQQSRSASSDESEASKSKPEFTSNSINVAPLPVLMPKSAFGASSGKTISQSKSSGIVKSAKASAVVAAPAADLLDLSSAFGSSVSASTAGAVAPFGSAAEAYSRSASASASVSPHHTQQQHQTQQPSAAAHQQQPLSDWASFESALPPTAVETRQHHSAAADAVSSPEWAAFDSAPVNANVNANNSTSKQSLSEHSAKVKSQTAATAQTPATAPDFVDPFADLIGDTTEAQQTNAADQINQQQHSQTTNQQHQMQQHASQSPPQHQIN